MGLLEIKYRDSDLGLFGAGSDQHSRGLLLRFKGDVGETSERRGGAHVGFSERMNIILNRTELNCGIYYKK